MRRPSFPAWIAARLLFAIFCWATAAYAWVASSTFALLQFLRPRVFPWVGAFADGHVVAGWMWLLLAGGIAWFDVQRRDGSRWLALPWLAICIVAVVWNTIDPVLARLTGGPGSIVVGAVALVPAIYASAIEHAAAWRYLRRQHGATTEDAIRGSEARVFIVAVSAALFTTAVYAALASISLAGAFEPDLLTAGLARGLGWSLIDHLWVACATFLAIAAVARITKGRFILQYALLFVLLTAALAAMFHRLAGDALGMQGVPALLAAVTFGLSVAGTWAGLRVRCLRTQEAVLVSPLDVYFGRPQDRSVSLPAVLPIAAAAALAWVCLAVARAADWDFVLLKTGVLFVWFLAFGAAYRVTPGRIRAPGWTIALVCLVPLVAQQALHANTEQARQLARYEVYNPSFRLTRGLLHELPATPSFDRFLRDHTNVSGHIPPLDIDFVSPLAPVSPAQRPPIFLFVVDSLRPDYLGSYNPAVRFTPRLDAFAAESVVFRNAFTRFGGTGLSLPAIWAGAALPHKQYVLPFQPMNALEKLLDVNGYREWVDLDSIMQQLLPRSDRRDVLDPGAAPANHEWCGTLDQIAQRLAATIPPAALFGYALPQDIHMSRLPRTVDTGPEYRSFHAPYATKVHAVDACFGRFVDALKARGLYERSLVIVTADHGEMLGEDGRFGHSTHLFPPVIQVPLIVHLPGGAGHAATAAVDVDAVSLTTDIAPTIYQALGYAPRRANALMGRPLFDAGDDTSRARRREPVVIASSYGPVYAALRRNGRSLYIADGITGVDLAYERRRGGDWRETPVTRELRTIGQFLIRQHIDEVSRTFGATDTP